MNRLPPILGAAGLDFGLNPAISYALNPRPAVLGNDDVGESEPCVDLPPTISGSISGAAEVTCAETGDVYTIFDIIGINGGFVATYQTVDGETFWGVNVGTYEFSGVCPDGTPSETFYLTFFGACTDGIFVGGVLGSFGDYPTKPSAGGGSGLDLTITLG